MKKTIVWLIVILAIIVGIIWYVNSTDTTQPQQSIVNLSAQNESGMSGTATLTSMDGSTLVELDLTGAPEDIAQPAHIHSDSCADIGGVVYPLEFPVNGVSETTLNVSLDDILADLPLAINVHKSSEEISTYVACGDIVQ